MARKRIEEDYSSRLETIRAVLYCRVSSKQQTEGTSLDDQESKLAAEARRRGWSDPLIVRDEGQSAKDTNRPGFQKALDLLSSGERNVLMVTKLDRVARSSGDIERLSDQIKVEGWHIVVLEGSVAFDTLTATGQLVLTVLAAFAQFERDQLIERIEAGFKYQRSTGTGKVISGELEARIINGFRVDGLTMQAIAGQLNHEEVPTARGGIWRPSAIHRVLNRDSARTKKAAQLELQARLKG